jgi:hypothetical protein
MSKWSDWYDELPQQYKDYIANQPVWHDRDLYKYCTITFFIGILVGAILVWH